MPIFETDLTKCTGENDIICLFSTFVIEGIIEEKEISTYNKKSIIHLNKNKKELIDNFDTDILYKLKKYQMHGKLYTKENSVNIENNIKYTILITTTKIELEEIYHYYTSIASSNYYSALIEKLFEKTSKVYTNTALIGIKHLKIKSMDIKHLDFLDIVCNGKVEDSNHFYDNNVWLRYQANLH